MDIRPSSLLRATGVTAAVVLPERVPLRARVALAGTSYAIGSTRPGWQLLSVGIDDDRYPGWVNRASAPVTSTVSWTLAQALLVPAVRRLPVPRRVVAAVAYGAAVYAVDQAMVGLAAKARQAAATRAEEAAATPEPEPALNG